MGEESGMDTTDTELDAFATGSAMVGIAEASFPELDCSRRGKGLVKISNVTNTTTVSCKTAARMSHFHLTDSETVGTLGGFSGGKYSETVGTLGGFPGGKYSTTYIEIKV